MELLLRGHCFFETCTWVYWPVRARIRVIHGRNYGAAGSFDEVERLEHVLCERHTATDSECPERQKSALAYKRCNFFVSSIRVKERVVFEKSAPFTCVNVPAASSAVLVAVAEIVVSLD